MFWQTASHLTWRSELILAGRAGQRQALAKSVHPVESDGDVGFWHSLQGFGRGKGELGGLVGKPRLCRLGMPWTAALQGESVHGDAQLFTERWNQGAENGLDRADKKKLNNNKKQKKTEKSQGTRNETSHTEPHNKIKRPWQCFIYQPFTQNYCCHSVWHELNTPAEKHRVVLNGNALVNFINYLWWVKRKIFARNCVAA